MEEVTAAIPDQQTTDVRLEDIRKSMVKVGAKYSSAGYHHYNSNAKSFI